MMILSLSSLAPTALPSIRPFAQAAAVLCFDLNNLQLLFDKLPKTFKFFFCPLQAIERSVIYWLLALLFHPVTLEL